VNRDALLLRHVALPGVPTLAVIGLYFTPVDLVGCANRGLAAFGVLLLALLAGIACGVVALRGRMRQDPSSSWWTLSAAILALPAVLLLGPLR
jgi:hypothetical protein